jgi:hypothetical protein
VTSVREAVERDLVLLEDEHEGISQTTLAALALTLADELDSASKGAKSAMVRTLLEILDRLAEHLDPDGEGDDGEDHSDIDELRARRARRHGGAGTAH